MGSLTGDLPGCRIGGPVRTKIGLLTGKSTGGPSGVTIGGREPPIVGDKMGSPTGDLPGCRIGGRVSTCIIGGRVSTCIVGGRVKACSIGRWTGNITGGRSGSIIGGCVPATI